MIGSYVQRMRSERGWSLEELGERAGGISSSYLSRLERGEVASPSLDVAARIGDALGVTVDQLMRGGMPLRNDPEKEQALAEARRIFNGTKSPEQVRGLVSLLRQGAQLMGVGADGSSVAAKKSGTSEQRPPSFIEETRTDSAPNPDDADELTLLYPALVGIGP